MADDEHLLPLLQRQRDAIVTFLDLHAKAGLVPADDGLISDLAMMNAAIARRVGNGEVGDIHAENLLDTLIKSRNLFDWFLDFLERHADQQENFLPTDFDARSFLAIANAAIARRIGK